MSEIIEIEIVTSLADEKRPTHWSWRATNGLPHKGAACFPLIGLRPADRCVVELRATRTGWALQRIVKSPAHTEPIPTSKKPLADPPKDAVEPCTQTTDFEPGDVLIRRIRFDSESNQTRIGKMRPCVVVEVTNSELRVRAIHGSNSAIRREGLGKRLLDWDAAGLYKPSVVYGQDYWLPRTGLPAIGRLTIADRRRIIEG